MIEDATLATAGGSAAAAMPADGIVAATAPQPSESAPAASGSLFGRLDIEQRIRTFAEKNERTLWAGAAGMTLFYASVIAAQVLTGAGGLSSLEREQQERRGQDAQAISVELVPDPDKTSKTQKWHEGAQAPAPTPAPPQPQQTASLPQPEVQAQPTQEQPTKEEPTKDEPTKEEQAKGGEPSIPDLEALVDAAADDLTEKIKRHYEQKPQKAQPERQAMYSGGGMQVRGTGASGKSDEFSKSVIAALMKTRPGPFALWGRVLVSFQITQTGDLSYVHLLHSSGNSALDQAAIEAIHKARFQIPPPGLSPEARTYIIDYIFG
jgi:TonB family protein